MKKARHRLFRKGSVRGVFFLLILFGALWTCSGAFAHDHPDQGWYVMYNSYVEPTEFTDGTTGPGTCSICGQEVEPAYPIPSLARQRGWTNPPPETPTPEPTPVFTDTSEPTPAFTDPPEPMPVFTDTPEPNLPSGIADTPMIPLTAPPDAVTPVPTEASAPVVVTAMPAPVPTAVPEPEKPAPAAEPSPDQGGDEKEDIPEQPSTPEPDENPEATFLPMDTAPPEAEPDPQDSSSGQQTATAVPALVEESATPVPTEIPTLVPTPEPTETPTEIPDLIVADEQSVAPTMQPELEIIISYLEILSNPATATPEPTPTPTPKSSSSSSSGKSRKKTTPTATPAPTRETRERDLKLYPVFSTRYPWRRLRMNPEPNIQVRKAGRLLWPQPLGSSPLQTLLNP